MVVVLSRLPATLELSAAAMLIAVAVAIPAGMLSAVRRGSLFDRLAMQWERLPVWPKSRAPALNCAVAEQAR